MGSRVPLHACRASGRPVVTLIQVRMAMISRPSGSEAPLVDTSPAGTRIRNIERLRAIAVPKVLVIFVVPFVVSAAPARGLSRMPVVSTLLGVKRRAAEYGGGARLEFPQGYGR